MRNKKVIQSKSRLLSASITFRLLKNKKAIQLTFQHLLFIIIALIILIILYVFYQQGIFQVKDVTQQVLLEPARIR